MRRIRGVLICGMLAIAMAIAGVGCGGDSGETTGASLSKAEFLQRGNDICRQNNVKIGEAAEEQLPRSGEPEQAELIRFTTSTLIPSAQSQIDEIAALGAPAGDEEEVEAIVAETEAAIEQAEKEPAALLSPEPGPFEEASRLATEYGLDACGEG